jgi:putative ABC transport system ATP-binding protein
MPIIQITDIHKQYGHSADTVSALRGVSLSVNDGEFIAIMGHSGSGKSTLLSILGGMNHPTKGTVTIKQTPIYTLPEEQLADFRASTLGFVFQSFHLIQYLTAIENVMLPLAITRMKKRDKLEVASTALAQVGLAAKRDRLPNQLSGGEQERVAIARAIVNRPHILFADEPTGNLDSATSLEIMRLFQQLNANGQTIVMVTHNPENCSYANRTILLRDGLVHSDTPQQAVASAA